MTITAKELRQLASIAWGEIDPDVGEDEYEDYEPDDYPDVNWDEAEEMEIPGHGTLKLIGLFGGEGDGAEYFAIVQLGEQFFKIKTYYSSWDSTDWEADWYEVVPAQKTITVYKRK
ncbi:hypothetical protein SEA_NICEHOUSE_175 [Rhodococcus phage NiceHouse]|nr:hypothetical protein SEA_NICEHOUSE_175 [Rhodococcus phage NiceHouse]